MKYLRIIDGEPTGELVSYQYMVKEINSRNITLPNIITSEVIESLGYLSLESPIVPTGYKMKYNTFLKDIIKKDSNGVYYRDLIEDTLPEEKALVRKERKWKEVRAKRDKLLLETDFSQVNDSKNNYIYEEYRQLLRDIPQNYDDPFLVEFPTLDLTIRMNTLEQDIQNYINQTVKAIGYDNVDSIAKYLVAGNPFYAEVTAISLWVGNVWVYAHQVQADVLAGIRTMPTIEELIAELPTLGAVNE